jgi:hypothetical protein
MGAFLRGRALIAAAGDELDPAQLGALRIQRDAAVLAWEQAYAATIVHYLNQVLRHMESFGGDGYTFLDHAKHWSEGKGFALGLQFNPRSKLSREGFLRLHALLRDAPVLPTAPPADIAQYKADLLEARALLQAAYGFDPANIGGATGEGGW